MHHNLFVLIVFFSSSIFDYLKESVDFREKLNYCDHLFNQCNTQCTLQSASKNDIETNFSCKYLIKNHQNQSTNNNSRIIINQVKNHSPFFKKIL